MKGTGGMVGGRRSAAAVSMTNLLRAEMIVAEGDLGWGMVAGKEVALGIGRAIDRTFGLGARVGGGFRSRL